MLSMVRSHHGLAILKHISCIHSQCPFGHELVSCFNPIEVHVLCFRVFGRLYAACGVSALTDHYACYVGMS